MYYANINVYMKASLQYIDIIALRTAPYIPQQNTVDCDTPDVQLRPDCRPKLACHISSQQSDSEQVIIVPFEQTVSSVGSRDHL